MNQEQTTTEVQQPVAIPPAGKSEDAIFDFGMALTFAAIAIASLMNLAGVLLLW